MTGTFGLAWKFVAFHRARTIVLVACLALTMSLPVGMRILVFRFDEQLSSRAASTPLIAGAAGSRFDLALHALYFRGQPPAETAMGEADRIDDSGYAQSIPIFSRYRAGGFPLVGTTADYLRFRQLKPQAGSGLRRLGDCLLGSRVAEQLQLSPGDSLLTEPELVFDPDGSFPLKLRVAGVLAESSSPDDEAVFVEIHTAWIVAGIGHGHSDDGDSESQIEEREHDPGLIEFTEITDDNVASFHFHGSPNQFPLTAIIGVPNDERAETLLLGRYIDPDDSVQLLNPGDVIDELLQFVIRLRRFFDLAFVALAIITALFVVLVVALSLKLRQREFETMHRLGCSRSMVIRLVAAELTIVGLMSGVVFAGLQLLVWMTAPQIVSHWLNG